MFHQLEVKITKDQQVTNERLHSNIVHQSLKKLLQTIIFSLHY